MFSVRYSDISSSESETSSSESDTSSSVNENEEQNGDGNEKNNPVKQHINTAASIRKTVADFSISAIYPRGTHRLRSRFTRRRRKNDKDKFQKLKERRKLISKPKIPANLPSTSQSISLANKSERKNQDDEKTKKKTTKRKKSQNDNLSKLNEFIPQAIQVTDFETLNKKKRIEKDLDEAIKEKEFERAQEISDEITKRQLATQIKGAFDAQKFAKITAEKEAKRKRKQRRKLKWAFDQKERWETKGNM